jgi:hypothetical protein
MGEVFINDPQLCDVIYEWPLLIPEDMGSSQLTSEPFLEEHW